MFVEFEVMASCVWYGVHVCVRACACVCVCVCVCVYVCVCSMFSVFSMCSVFVFVLSQEDLPSLTLST